MDTVELTYPCYALAIEPVPLDSEGRPDIDFIDFVIFEDDDHGTPFLVVFRNEKLIPMCLDEFQPPWTARTIPIETEDHFHRLRKMLGSRCQRQIGVLLDPDGRMQGYPLPPANWPDIENN